MALGTQLGLVLGSGAQGIEPQGSGVVVLVRHGAPAYTLPHDLDHIANMRALHDAGCDRVLALGSVGGLRPELTPGTFVCPHDFIALDASPLSSLDGPATHRVPGFDPAWRAQVLAACSEAEVEVREQGVYWQATGPRLETPAEIRFVAAHADVIGMTIATECVIAGELGLRYAALCVVDNLANGVGATELTLDEISANREQTRTQVADALAKVLPRLA